MIRNLKSMLTPKWHLKIQRRKYWWTSPKMPTRKSIQPVMWNQTWQPIHTFAAIIYYYLGYFNSDVPLILAKNWRAFKKKNSFFGKKIRKFLHFFFPGINSTNFSNLGWGGISQIFDITIFYKNPWLEVNQCLRKGPSIT